MNRVPTAAVAAATLVLGFLVAQVTGVRALGGVVLLAGVVWCGMRERRRTPVWRLAVALGVGAVCFVAAHVLADPLGPWLSVAVVAAVLAVATYGLVDRPAAGRSARPA